MGPHVQKKYFNVASLSQLLFSKALVLATDNTFALFLLC